ncbi:MAG: 5-(carboxyamino)imidazole ribonucleotide mutase [Chitinophagaceae bacterium]|nr:5-(carboxyamino)imidazole ribonucleotide mutase [Chitinophagaceae bacterium]MCB9044522.1 5-(carboxyamino)imidazole ribonucleotide mutase [Chitinophagales bacterium]
MSNPVVGIIMGSSSDKDVMKAAADVLKNFGVPYEFTVVSAHRSPQWMYEYCEKAQDKGLKVIIAGAGGAAHLPGMVAALTTLPVIGVPVKSRNSIDGWDSLLSIVQMPNDVPVATVAVNGAHNAGLLAVEMLAISDAGLMEQLHALKKANREKIDRQQEEVKGL